MFKSYYKVAFAFFALIFIGIFFAFHKQYVPEHKSCENLLICFLITLINIDSLIVGLITLFFTIHFSIVNSDLEKDLNNANNNLQKQIYNQNIFLQNRETLLNVYRNFCKAHYLIYINQDKLIPILKNQHKRQEFLNKLDEINMLLSESRNQTTVLYSSKYPELSDAVVLAAKTFRKFCKLCNQTNTTQIPETTAFKINELAQKFIDQTADKCFDIYFEEPFALKEI